MGAEKRPAGYNYLAPESESVEDTYVAPSAPRRTYASPDSDESPEVLMPYNYGFVVEGSEEHEDVNFGHATDSDGEVVKGQYRVALPNCLTQVVTYTATAEEGYKAEVSYEGEECFPSVEKYQASSIEQTYRAPDSDSVEQVGYAYNAPN